MNQNELAWTVVVMISSLGLNGVMVPAPPPEPEEAS